MGGSAVPGTARPALVIAAVVTVAGLAVAGCHSGSATTRTTPPSTPTSTVPTGVASTSTTGGAPSPAIDPASIPIGDGHVSSAPKVGYVDSCVTQFGGGGAAHTGSWFNAAAGTWDSTAKPAVLGSVSWPNASFSVTVSGSSRAISGNDLPTDHTTGTFPIASTDPAYQYDHNPNTIEPQSIAWTLPLDPIAAATPNCLGLGPIGVLDDGVLLFDALDAAGRDAGAHEVLDSCGEHPESTGALHHHFVPSCLTDKLTGGTGLVGYAADGYGIYVERDAQGKLLTDADLDACHGRTSTVLWNGKEQDVYHYDATLEYPYTLGCYHGSPIDTHTR